jgi:hypothetical protein
MPSVRQENNLKICKLEGGGLTEGGGLCNICTKSMPTLEQALPKQTVKSLNRKASRNRRVIELEQVTMIGQSLLGLRRLQRELISSVKLSEPKDLPSLAGAICKIIEQRRILLRIPGPPTGGATKAATPAPINAQILDAEPIEQVSSE